MSATPQLTVTVEQKSTGTAYILWLFFGLFGGHQFYLGKTGRAVSYLFTLGWLTVGVWIDLFTMGSQVRAQNAKYLAEAKAKQATLAS